MLLIAEIILTIFAWRKGWRWIALIPLASVLILGIIIGFGVAASGGDINSINGLTTMLDIIAVVALILLVVNKPKENKSELNV